MISFLFPAQCLHCNDPLRKAGQLLCGVCTEVLPWLESDSRCGRCFLEKCCCSKILGPLYRRMAVFAHLGPAASLIHHFKFGGREEIAEVAASLLLVQLERVGMEWPDLIVPVPHTPWHAFFRGYRPTELLANALGKLMGIKVAKVLKRSPIILPQRTRTREERKSLSNHTFSLRRSQMVTDRKILLIDDVTTTGATLQKCAEVLKMQHPLQVSGCTLTLVEY